MPLIITAVYLAHLLHNFLVFFDKVHEWRDIAVCFEDDGVFNNFLQGLNLLLYLIQIIHNFDAYYRGVYGLLLIVIFGI